MGGRSNGLYELNLDHLLHSGRRSGQPDVPLLRARTHSDGVPVGRAAGRAEPARARDRRRRLHLPALRDGSPPRNAHGRGRDRPRRDEGRARVPRSQELRRPEHRPHGRPAVHRREGRARHVRPRRAGRGERPLGPVALAHEGVQRRGQTDAEAGRDLSPHGDRLAEIRPALALGDAHAARDLQPRRTRFVRRGAVRDAADQCDAGRVKEVARGTVEVRAPSDRCW